MSTVKHILRDDVFTLSRPREYRMRYLELALRALFTRSQLLNTDEHGCTTARLLREQTSPDDLDRLRRSTTGHHQQSLSAAALNLIPKAPPSTADCGFFVDGVDGWPDLRWIPGWKHFFRNQRGLSEYPSISKVTAAWDRSVLKSYALQMFSAIFMLDLFGMRICSFSSELVDRTARNTVGEWIWDSTSWIESDRFFTNASPFLCH